MKAIATILAMCCTLPIWFYLLYKVLVLVNATELMWFLYWIYLPVTFLVATLSELAKR